MLWSAGYGLLTSSSGGGDIQPASSGLGSLLALARRVVNPPLVAVRRRDDALV